MYWMLMLVVFGLGYALGKIDAIVRLDRYVRKLPANERAEIKSILRNHA